MTRNKILGVVFVLFVIIIAVVVGGYFYLTSTKATPPPTNVTATGSLVDTDTTSNDTSNSDNTSTTTPGVIPKLRHISTSPVAGYDFVTTKNGYSIWYVDRATGNVFKTATSTLDVTRVTNTTIPKVYEAYIGAGGSNIVLRTLNETTGGIQTFIGSPKAKKGVSATSTDNTLELAGIFTSDALSMISMAPSKDTFFGITGSGSGIGNIYSFAAKSTNIFSNPLKKWIPQWVNASTILMTSAPSAKTQNIAYFLNPTTKAFTKALSPRNGLVASASPSASHVLYSENKGNRLLFGVLDVKTGSETTLAAATIPDKCGWSSTDTTLAYCGVPKSGVDGVFPDDWYQGKIQFNDEIRSIDAKTLQITTLTDNLEQQAGAAIDVVNVKVSSDNKYLLFTNKRDLSLWMLEI